MTYDFRISILLRLPMIRNFDFSETHEKVFLTFYKPPKSKTGADPLVDSPKIELKDPKTLLFNSEEISLYAPVCMHAIVNTDYKTEISLTKEVPAKWNSIDGRVCVPKPRSDIYDVPKEDQSEMSLMELFRDIYAKGDEDIKRAMNKSLEESGGTVLSTNWNDVKSKKVNPDDQ